MYILVVLTTEETAMAKIHRCLKPAGPKRCGFRKELALIRTPVKEVGIITRNGDRLLICAAYGSWKDWVLQQWPSRLRRLHERIAIR